MKKFEILETIVPDIPATRIALVTDFVTPVAKWLNALIQKREASLDVKVFNDSRAKVFEKSLENKSEFLYVEAFAEESMRYDNKGYKYDTLFLHVEKSPKNATHLLERIYASMKNGGAVVVVVDEKNKLWSDIEQRLDMCNFVAINPIEIDTEHTVYYAKKMHGWDGAR